MLLLETVDAIQKYLSHAISEGKRIGFVPTMGALHEGHLSLIEKSRLENDLTVCSIFVNPIQFNDKKDLENYPRDLKGDMLLLKGAACDVLFHPSVGEMYPDGIPQSTDLGPIEKVLEGAHRPGHFSGVSTVVKRLFEIVQPNNAYFGLKDYQQYLVVKTMVERFRIKVNVIGCPTLREKDGLAMSSRNRRLGETGRKEALLLYHSLQYSKNSIGTKSISSILQHINYEFKIANTCELEYFEIVDADTLQPIIDLKKSDSVIACIAAFVDGVRLIDNLILIP